MYVKSKPQSRKADSTTGFFLSLLFYRSGKILCRTGWVRRYARLAP